MSAICPLVRSSFSDYASDALPAPQRRILREHLAACAECRDLAVAQEPAMLFARPFPAEEVPSADAARILANVRTAVAFATTEERIRRTSGRRRTLSGAAAAVAALAALLLIVPGTGARRPEAVAASRPTPLAESAPALQPVGLPSDAEMPAEAIVYDWNPGAGREEPRVVWIVDRGLDI